jgi:hypothetical protein
MVTAAERENEEINDLFDGAKRRARGLAEDLLSLDGKLTYLFWTEAEYHQYLKAKYERRVLNPDALRKALDEGTQRFLRELQAIENELLVALRADLEDLPLNGLRAPAEAQVFHKRFQETAREVERLLSRNMKETAAKELTSFVLGDVAGHLAVRVMSAAATRLGISAALLGSGAYSGVATLGITLVAGVVVDYLLDFVLREFGYDPEEDVAARVREGLEQMRLALVAPGKDALRVALALDERVKNDPDEDVQVACYLVLRQIMRGGQLGLAATLSDVGQGRLVVWKVTVQKLIHGESYLGNALAKWQEALARERPVRTTEEAQARARRTLLLVGEPVANVDSILRVLASRNPDHRIEAAKAAALLYGRAS